MRHDLPRSIGFWGASAIMVGIIIGSGIFRTPPDIAGVMSSPALILCLWAAGGLLSLFGALTYAEMATMFPHSGGVYVFLREGFGRPVAFVFGWTYLLITKPFAAAGIAVVFAEHLNPLLGVEWDVRYTTASVLLGLTIVNTFGIIAGAGLAKVLTSLKVGALLAIVGLAAFSGQGDAHNFAATPAPMSFLDAIAPVMVGIMWTYDGWSDAGAIAGEVKDPQRQLPRVYLVGTLAVTLLYLAVNAAYMWVIPLAEMRTTDTVAPLVVQRLLGGDAAVVIVSAVVLLSSLGSTHGSIITGARVTFAQARDGLLFRFLGHIEPRFKTPAVSLWLQLALACIALWYSARPPDETGQPQESGFATLAGAFVFTMWIFYGLAAAALFVLRFRRPMLPRPYRAWGYPVVPALFILAAGAMTGLDLRANWEQDRIWLAVLALGIPVYFVWAWFYPDSARRDCPSCGHDRTEASRGPCPACGRAVSPR